MTNSNETPIEYFALDLDKFKENPEENLILILEALDLSFSHKSVNFDKLVPLLKMDTPLTYNQNEPV